MKYCGVIKKDKEEVDNKSIWVYFLQKNDRIVRYQLERRSET